MTAPGKDFLFTMTTGRSGTQFLTELLRRNLPQAECHHELLGWERFGVDTPDLSHMTLFNSQGNIAKVREFWAQKLDRLAAHPGRFYAETAHMLMKAGLIENLAPLRAAGRVHLVALERDPYATILSFLGRHDFTSNGNWWLWYLDPRYPKNLVASHKAVEHGTIGICLWYIAEVRTRAAYYAKRLAADGTVIVHRLTLDALRTAEGAAGFLRALGVDRAPQEIDLPPPQNINLKTAELTPDEDRRLRDLVTAMTIDAPAMADQAIAAGLGF